MFGTRANHISARQTACKMARRNVEGPQAGVKMPEQVCLGINRIYWLSKLSRIRRDTMGTKVCKSERDGRWNWFAGLAWDVSTAKHGSIIIWNGWGLNSVGSLNPACTQEWRRVEGARAAERRFPRGCSQVARGEDSEVWPPFASSLSSELRPEQRSRPRLASSLHASPLRCLRRGHESTMKETERKGVYIHYELTGQSWSTAFGKLVRESSVSVGQLRKRATWRKFVAVT